MVFLNPLSAVTRRLAVVLGGVLLCSAMLTGCGGSSATGPTLVSGTAVKAVIDAASVTLHQINPDGSIGAQVAGPFTTAADGTWSGDIPAGEVGPFYVRVTGGSYIDEATGNSVTLGAGDEMLGLFHAALGNSAAVTPFTHGMVGTVQNAMATDGTAAATAVTQAAAAFTGLLGFDLTQVQPVDPNNIPAGVAANPGAYAALLGGLAEAANQALAGSGLTSPFEVVMALALDLADGQLDGVGPDGNPLSVAGAAGAVSLPVLDSTGLGALSNHVQAFAANANLVGLTLPINLALAVPSTPGSLTFSGAGSALLGTTTYSHTDSGFFNSGFADVATFTNGAGGDFQVGISLELVFDGSSGLTKITVIDTETPFEMFEAFGEAVGGVVGPIPGATVNGRVVTFSNVVLGGGSGGETLRIDGSIDF